MAISKDEARQRGSETDAPQLLAIIKMALQNFLNSMALQGFQVPVAVTLKDAHGDTLRAFTVERGGAIVPGHSDDPTGVFVFPLTAVAMDADGKIGRMTITENGTEETYESPRKADSGLVN